jgi:hypothetical protein
LAKALKVQVCLIFFMLVSFLVTAQKKYTISGYAKDIQNGETLIGATITVAGNSKGITSNQYGFYSITLLEGNYELTCSYAGYQPKATEIKLDTDQQLDFNLVTKGALQELIISSKKTDGNIKTAQMGRFVLPIDQIKALPAFLGETDLLKTIQLLPGVRNAGEGSAGLSKPYIIR